MLVCDPCTQSDWPAQGLGVKKFTEQMTLLLLFICVKVLGNVSEGSCSTTKS